jgi:hypothetical protein
MTKTKQQFTVTFTIPSDWDASDFIGELAGAYDDMAGREAAEQVEYVVGEVTEVSE